MESQSSATRPLTFVLSPVAGEGGGGGPARRFAGARRTHPVRRETVRHLDAGPRQDFLRRRADLYSHAAGHARTLARLRRSRPRSLYRRDREKKEPPPLHPLARSGNPPPAAAPAGKDFARAARTSPRPRLGSTERVTIVESLRSLRKLFHRS